jgi:urease accessory protein
MSVGMLLLGDARFPAGGHAHSGGVEPAATAGTVTDLASLDVFLRGRLRTAGMVAAGLAAAACARAHVPADRDAQGRAAQSHDASGLDAQDCAARSHDASRYDARGCARLDRAELPAAEWTWAELDAEADARTPSPAQREASRRQGRALLRAARIAWPDAEWLADLAAPLGAAVPLSVGPQHAVAPRELGAPMREHRSGPHHAVVLGAAAAAAGCAPGEAAHVAAYQSVAGPASAAVRLLALDPMRAAGVVAAMAGAIAATAGQAARHAAGPLDELPFPSAPALDLLAEAHVTAEVRLFES